MMTVAVRPEHSAGDPIPAKCAVIRVHVTEAATTVQFD